MNNDAAAPGSPRAGARRTAAGRLPQSSDRPPYRLVADDLRRQILVGRLAPGEQVPSSRILQEDYGIAGMTARSAVRVLRDEGLVHTEHGRGTFVANSLPAPAGSVSETAARPHMPTDEYTELMRRVDELSDVLDTLLRILGQAGNLTRRTDRGVLAPAPGVREIRLPHGAPAASAGSRGALTGAAVSQLQAEGEQ